MGLSMRNFVGCLAVCLGLSLLACSGDKKNTSNTPPVFTSDGHFNLDENQQSSVMTLTATDANGDTLSFSLEGIDAQWFILDSQTGVLSFIKPPDFETPRDQNGDNRYELTAVVGDEHGSQASQTVSVQVNNVTFSFEVLSPRPGMLLELERYSRIPLAVRLEYDHPERLQIVCNGEILNPDSDSRATWTGSLAIAPGAVDVNMVFWRGDQVLTTYVVPVRHQHLISAHDHLVYDSTNDLAVIPHPERMETLVINLQNNSSRKLYPWSGHAPDLKGLVFDPNTATSLFNDGGIFRVDSLTGLVTTVASDLENTLAPEQQGAITLDAGTNHLFVAGQSGYAQVDLGSGAVESFTYTGGLSVQRLGNMQLAYADTENRLLVAQENAAGVDAFIPGETTPATTFAATWTTPHRFGEVEMDESRNRLFITGYSGHSLNALDLASGTYATVSGANLVIPEAPPRGMGPLLHTPKALALDTNRDQLLTTSASRLMAVDPDSGNRSLIFDSSVGSGELTSGFAGIWISPDGARAIGLDRQLGRYYHIDLRTGEKTAGTYETQLMPQLDYRVQGAKMNTAGKLAIIHYRSRDAAVVGGEYLDLVNLETGSQKRLLQDGPLRSHVDFNFSQPDDQLLLLVRDEQNYVLWFYSLAQNDFTQQQNLTLPAAFTPLALHRVNEKIYVLGRAVENSIALFQLYEFSDPMQSNLMLSFSDKGAGKNNDADISTLHGQTQLVIVLPEQEPKFWDITGQTEIFPAFTEFKGSDQARDFYSIDDFDELYYFRANAGLHLCWRYNCGILAN